MYNTNDILSLLEQGKSIEEIGEQFASALNEAKATYDKNQEVKKLEDEKKANQRADMRDLVLFFTEYCEAYIDDKEFVAEVQESAEKIQKDDKAVDELCASVDSIVELTQALKEMNQFVFPKTKAMGDWLEHFKI